MSTGGRRWRSSARVISESPFDCDPCEPFGADIVFSAMAFSSYMFPDWDPEIQDTCTLICFGFALSDLGNVINKSPFLYSAPTLPSSISTGKVVVLTNFPRVSFLAMESLRLDLIGCTLFLSRYGQGVVHDRDVHRLRINPWGH